MTLALPVFFNPVHKRDGGVITCGNFRHTVRPDSLGCHDEFVGNLCHASFACFGV